MSGSLSTWTPADLATWNFLTLQMRFDDGFVAFLNGTRISSANEPTTCD